MRKDVNDMFEIKGKVTTAICYAKVIEDEAIEQIRRMCDYDLTRGSKVRIMPDVHAGKGFMKIRLSLMKDHLTVWMKCTRQSRNDGIVK